MLVLELKRRGYNAVGSPSVENAALVVFDLDSSVQPEFNVPCITFSNSRPADLKRPFSIESLVEIISKKLALSLPERIEQRYSLVPEYTRHSVYFGDREIVLSELEFSLFNILYENVGRPVSKTELEYAVWGTNGNDNRLRVYIKYLRDKLEPVYKKRIICSLRDHGYVLKID